MDTRSETRDGYVMRDSIKGFEIAVSVYAPEGNKNMPLCQQIAEAAMAYAAPVIRSYLDDSSKD